ncbi:MAG: DUF4815 domain-containing protein [Anaerolineae bacterium]|nr:DUF4815 domain-containing protein [Anaerolineae bacterium]
MARKDYCCLKARGEIYLAKAAAYKAGTARLIGIGNASVFEISASVTEEAVPNYTSAAGGNDCVAYAIDKVSVDITMMCHSAENLALLLYGAGASDNVASGAVANEPLLLFPGALTPLVHLPDPPATITVQSPDGSTTYVAGTDYLVTPAGSIMMPETGSSIPAVVITGGVGAPNARVSYTKKKASLIQLLTNLGGDYFLHFAGVNLFTGRPVQHQLYLVRPGPAKKLAMVGDSASKLEATWAAQPDYSRSPGTVSDPLSQYGTIKLAGV